MEKTEEERVTENNLQDLQENLKLFLAEKKGEELLQLLKENPEYLKNEGLAIVPQIGECISDENHLNFPEFTRSCEHGLLEVVRGGNAKEIIIVLLELLELKKDDFFFITILGLMKESLLRLPVKNSWYSMVLSILHDHVNSTPLPENYNLEGEEKELLKLDPNVARIIDYVVVASSFFEFVVDRVKSPDSEGTASDKELVKKSLLPYILSLFGHPLTYLPLLNKEDPVNAASSQLIECVCRLTHLHSVLHHSPNPEDEIRVPPISFGTFFYLILVEGYNLGDWPSVYRTKYVYSKLLPSANALMQQPYEFSIHKGLSLLISLQGQVEDASLSHDNLDVECYRQLVNSLVGIMVGCRVRELRLLALAAFKKYLVLFDTRGRCRLILFTFVSCQHPGMQGVLVSLAKDEIIRCMNLEPPDDVFRGRNLQKLLELFLELPEGETTDLLENSDRIMGVLNFLIFVLSCRSDYVQVAWKSMDRINGFVGAMRKGIDMSRAHYQLEQKNSEESKSKKGEKMSYGDAPEQKRELLQKALNTFDMMQLSVVRLEEVIDLKQQTKNLATAFACKA